MGHSPTLETPTARSLDPQDDEFCPKGYGPPPVTPGSTWKWWKLGVVPTQLPGLLKREIPDKALGVSCPGTQEEEGKESIYLAITCWAQESGRQGPDF